MVPNNQVFVTGLGVVTGDALNTMIQTVDTVATLRTFIGVSGMQVSLQGIIAPNDGGQGDFYWNSGGTAADDNGVSTVVPYGSGSGQWTRIGRSVQGPIGFMPMEGGVVMQWGFSTVQLANSYGTTTVTLPDPYTHGIFQIVASDDGTFLGAYTGAVVYACSNFTQTTFTLSAATPAVGGQSFLVGARWIAIGN